MSDPGRRDVSSALLFCAFVLVIFPSLGMARDWRGVDQTLARATQWLYNQQSSDHTWEREFAGHGNQATGQTALAVYALLSAGQSRTDPRLAGAIDYLLKTPTTGVYALGMRCQVWLMLPPTPEIRAAMTRDARVLLQSLKRDGDAGGFYDYNPSAGRNYSHSRAQYAVLGLWAASQMGAGVPREYWQLTEKAWISHQEADGGWKYIYKRRQYPTTMGMTAVGVATLLITDAMLHQDETPASGAAPRAAIARGMSWLAGHIAQLGQDDSPRAYPFATLYAMERIGTFSGAGTIGGVNWYDKGAEILLARQGNDGSFPPEFGSRIVSTSFAVLFLSRGAFPLMMGKLDDSSAQNARAQSGWNQYPRDLANLSTWTSAQMERPLSWRIISLEAPLSDWHEAPVLLISGTQALNYSREQIDRLRQFIQEGGLVLGNADHGSTIFAKSFQSLGRQLFPKYEFRPLPASHLIYTAEQFPRAKWKRRTSSLGMSNGVRELMILAEDSDPARAWQLRQSETRSEAFEFAADIYQYATSKMHFGRRGENDLKANGPATASAKKLKLARIEYAGNWDPEPDGWRRLGIEMHDLDHIELAVTPVKLGAGALDGYSAAHLTGTGKLELQPDQRDELRRFVLAGGTLLIDSAGGSTAFADSIEHELARIFPDQAPRLSEPLPLEDPVFTSIESSKIKWRDFARSRLKGNLSLRLRGIRLRHRLAVVYSREDLSAGLAGLSTDGIIGYEPHTAGLLMRAMLRACCK